MNKALLVTLLLLPAAAHAATFADLLRQAYWAQGSSPELPLEGLLADQLRVPLGVGQLRGKATLIKQKTDPGCGRYALELFASSSSERILLATVQLDWCQDGLLQARRR